jgi:phage terminase large subunit-like protein
MASRKDRGWYAGGGRTAEPADFRLRAIARRSHSTEQYGRRYWAIDHVNVYPKQRELFELGATKRERLFKCANQSGKSFASAIEVSYHLTGRYPAWWQGHRFAKPIAAWVCSETAILLRDVMQRLLFGEPGDPEALGTGSVPLDLIADKPSLARGITDAFDTVRVRHVSGGVSTVRFRSYQAGRESFMGATLDLIVFDEEPPADVYSEGITRITATNGRALLAYTPMGGPGEVTRRFTQDDSPDRAIVKMSLYDVADVPGSHMTREMVEAIKRNCPPHEVRTRVYGEDMLGEGSIFPIEEETITEPPIVNVPPHWMKIWGIDFGINHPFAAVLLLYDSEADVVHVHHCIRIKGQTPLQHAVPMKAIGADVVVAYPADGDNREQGTGDPLANLYRAQNLRMMPSHATWPDGTVSTERGILEIWQRMTTGRFFVANTQLMWFEEFRGYHRKNNQIVKLYDDLMSATRVGIMALRHAKQGPLGSGRPPRVTNAQLNTDEAIARRSSFNIFTGRGHGAAADFDPFTGE